MFRKLVPALVAPLLLVACASEADDGAVEADATTSTSTEPEAPLAGDPIAALRAAPDAAAAAGSGRFEMVVDMDLGAQGAFEMTATGGYSGDTMSMDMDLGAMMRGLAESTGESIPPGFNEPMQMAFDGEVFYLRMPQLDTLTGTSGWLSATPEDLGQSSGALGLGPTSSPTAMLDSLRGVTDDLEEVGTDDVRGTPTTHYRATLDLEEALAEVPEDQREALEAQLDQLGGTAIGDLPVDVWLDGDGLVRRMVMGFDGMEEMMGGSMTMTTELFDFGTPFEVQVPHPGDVTPLTEVLPDMAGALG